MYHVQKQQMVLSQACSTKESRCNLQMFCVLAVMIVKGVVINKQHGRGQDSLQVPVLIQQRMLSVTSSVSWGKLGRDSLQVPGVITSEDAVTNKKRELGKTGPGLPASATCDHNKGRWH